MTVEKGNKRSTRHDATVAILVATLHLCVVAVSGTRATEEAATKPGTAAENPGFEAVSSRDGKLPDVWELFASESVKAELLDVHARSGAKCLKMEAQQRAHAYQGVFQRLSVEPGDACVFEGYVRNNPEDGLTATAYGQLCVEWLDAQGKELGRGYSEPWDSSLSRLRWTRVSIPELVAPDTCATAVFGIHLSDGKEAASGSFLLDDVTAERR